MMMIGLGAFLFSLSFSMLNTLGVINVGANDVNPNAFNEQAWNNMIDPSTSTTNQPWYRQLWNNVTDFVTGIVNYITGGAMFLAKMMYGVAYVKGIIDQFTMNQEPYNTITWYLQSGIWAAYFLAGIGWWLNKPGP